MTTHVEYLKEHVLYDNPIPLSRSRHGFFPSLIQLPTGELLAMVAIGEAFESADMTTYVLRSGDRGQSWHQCAFDDDAAPPFASAAAGFLGGCGRGGGL